MLCSILVLWTSRPLNILGSYDCYPGLSLVPLPTSPRSRTCRLLWHWLAHNNSSLRWDGWSTSLPPSAIFSLHIFILSLVVYNIRCRGLSLSLLVTRCPLLATSLALLATAALPTSTSSWAACHLGDQCCIPGQLESL